MAHFSEQEENVCLDRFTLVMPYIPQTQLLLLIMLALPRHDLDIMRMQITFAMFGWQAVVPCAPLQPLY